MSPQQSLAHYRILAKIGEGGMGEVYRALDTKLGREVAIKIIPENFAQDADRMARFTREAQVLASLNHPNIAAIHGVEERALVMELVGGATLAGPLPTEEALPLIHQLIDALEYAHEKGIVHRDLKPANIKITPEGRLKVLDFGLAKALSPDAPAGNPASSPTMTMRATLAGVIMGTAGYMSPEQARGQAVDKRADIWAFGVVVYEMLTGRALFEGETVSDTLAAVLRHDLDVTAVPPAFQRLLRLCLTRDVRQRLRDIGDARVLLGEPAAAVPLKGPRGFPIWAVAVPALLALAGLAVSVLHFREKPPPAAPVRFQIPAPDKASFGETGMALSPDGRKLAFIASGADGGSKLWVRLLDSAAAQALPGTEGAQYLPFWSPDSRFLGFPVGGKLKKIEASGGPPQTLCEVPDALIGGSWSRDGVIIFSTPNGGLFQVSQAGGEAKRLTTMDESHGELGHMRPWFLPDGRHFLYVTRTTRPAEPAIYLATLDGKERKRLVSTNQSAVYAPPGVGSEHSHLLFLREGTLMALPLDRRFEPVGEPFPLAEQVGARASMGFFSVSANGVLAYRNGVSAGSQLLWFDRQGKPLGTLGSAGMFPDSVKIAPDGKRVAVGTNQPGNADIWVVDVERGVPTRFTFDPASERSPIWSPDGTRLSFASDRGHAGIFDIYWKDSSGSGNEELLLKSGMSMVPLDWSPDGRYLLYSVASPNTGMDLWVLPVPAGKPFPYLQGPYDEVQGQFSPDGRWIAYRSNESGSNEVYVQSFPAGGGKFQISTARGVQPRWRRDGKEIFYFVGVLNRLMAVDVKLAPAFAAGTPKPLFNPQIVVNGLSSFMYDVAADGKRFLVSSTAKANGVSAEAPITVVLNWQAAVER